MNDDELIDHFAGLAMQALISSNNFYNVWENKDLELVADFAYAMAMHMSVKKEELIDGGVL